MGQIYDIFGKNGVMVPIKEPEISIGQIVWLNGYGQDKYHHDRLAVYKIEEDKGFGKAWWVVNLDKVERVKGETVIKNEKDLFGIGIYYTPGDIATQEEIDEALRKSTEFTKEEQRKSQIADEKNKAKKEQGKNWLEKNKPDWAKAFIVAEIRKDISDLYTDYFAYSTEKTVLLGFSKTTRNNFDEMRKFAGTYEPTKKLEEYKKENEHRENYSGGSGYYLGDKYDIVVRKITLSDYWDSTLDYISADPDSNNIMAKQLADVREIFYDTLRDNKLPVEGWDEACILKADLSENDIKEIVSDLRNDIETEKHL